MTIRYVYSGASGAGTGADWTNAYTTFGAAVTASNANGDLIYVADDHNEALSGNTTYTFAANVAFLCVNRTSGLISTGAFIGHASSARSITLAGGVTVVGYGVEFGVANLGPNITISNTTNAHFNLERCKLTFATTSSTSSLTLGYGAAVASKSFVRLKNCTLKFGSTSQTIRPRGQVEIEGGSIDATGTAPSVLLQGVSSSYGCSVIATGVDLSLVTGTLVGDNSSGTEGFVFKNCKLGSGVVPLATQTVTNLSSTSVWLYDCAAGDQHYHIAHYDAFGSTVVDTGIYANDGAQYDGTNRCSWKITTTANCSYYTPYVSPWFGRYHSATSAITPSIEILRDGSTTAYKDDEVWGEFAAKTTASSTQATFYDDRMTPLATAANQAAGVGTSGWTGKGASAWSGKLAPGSSFTPAEIGHLMARVVVGKASATVYIDPAIRGT